MNAMEHRVFSSSRFAQAYLGRFSVEQAGSSSAIRPIERESTDLYVVGRKLVASPSTMDSSRFSRGHIPTLSGRDFVFFGQSPIESQTRTAMAMSDLQYYLAQLDSVGRSFTMCAAGAGAGVGMLVGYALSNQVDRAVTTGAVVGGVVGALGVATLAYRMASVVHQSQTSLAQVQSLYRAVNLIRVDPDQAISQLAWLYWQQQKGLLHQPAEQAMAELEFLAQAQTYSPVASILQTGRDLASEKNTL